MSSDRCSGDCCHEFAMTGIGFSPEEIGSYLRERALDGTQIADMIIPLRRIEPGCVLPSGQVADRIPVGGGWIFTCRNFDASTRNCLAYDRRPGMCSDYPYGRVCEYTTCTWSKGRAGTHPPTDEHVHLPVLTEAAA